MSTETMSELLNQEQEYMRQGTGLTDWTYRDLPKLSVSAFDMFCAIVGEENLRWLTKAEYKYPNGKVAKRGQVMISPVGMENLRQYAQQQSN